MTITAILLLLLVLAAIAGPALATFIHNDGYGRRGPGSTPPRSHQPDLFDPRHRA